jgi:hypothetical protein
MSVSKAKIIAVSMGGVRTFLEATNASVVMPMKVMDTTAVVSCWSALGYHGKCNWILEQ